MILQSWVLNLEFNYQTIMLSIWWTFLIYYNNEFARFLDGIGFFWHFFLLFQFKKTFKFTEYTEIIYSIGKNESNKNEEK